MFEFLIDNTFAMFGGHVFQQIFLWVKTVHLFSSTYSFNGMKQTSYWGFSIKQKKKLARSLNFTFRAIDDVIPLVIFITRVTRMNIYGTYQHDGF